MFLTSTYFTTNHNDMGKEENVAIIRNIRNNDLKRANIVLDLEKKLVVKCRDYRKDEKLINGNQDYDDLYNYFYSLYPKQLDAAMESL